MSRAGGYGNWDHYSAYSHRADANRGALRSRIEKSTPVVRIISLGWLGASIYLPFSFIFYALDEPHIRFYLELGKLVARITLLAILFQFSHVGAAWSVTLAQLLNAIVSGLVIWVKLRRPNLVIDEVPIANANLPSERFMINILIPEVSQGPIRVRRPYFWNCKIPIYLSRAPNISFFASLTKIPELMASMRISSVFMAWFLTIC